MNARPSLFGLVQLAAEVHFCEQRDDYLIHVKLGQTGLQTELPRPYLYCLRALRGIGIGRHRFGARGGSLATGYSFVEAETALTPTFTIP